MTLTITKTLSGFEVRCNLCSDVRTWGSKPDIETLNDDHANDCAGQQVHRRRCCTAPKPEAMTGLGREDNAFITITCTNCWTDLVVLDPPVSNNTAPYVGRYQSQRETREVLR